MILSDVLPRCALTRTGTPGFFEGQVGLVNVRSSSVLVIPYRGVDISPGEQPDQRVAHDVRYPVVSDMWIFWDGFVELPDGAFSSKEC